MKPENPNPTWSANELVPFADRLRYMLLVHVVLIGTIAVTAKVAPGLVGVLPNHAYMILGAWAIVSLAATGIRRIWRSRGLALFGVTVIVDGLALVWLSEVGSVTNVRYLIFFDMVAIVLLASYRTGLKLALWYTLLLFTVFFAGRDGALSIPHVAAGTTARWDIGQLGVFVAAIWMVAIATAGFSSVNERELRRRRFDLEALARFAGALESANDRRAVASSFLDGLADAFPVGRLLLVTSGRHPVILGRRGLSPGIANPSQLEIPSALLRAQSAHRTLLLSSFDPESDAWLSQVMGDAPNCMVVPLYAEGGCLGALVAENATKNGSRVERRMVSIIERFAAHAALALRNAALLEQMERMAHTDGLTEVANRRAFEITLEREVARSIRTGVPLSLVMLDIDNFKALNDTHGHQVGDRVLREVAHALQVGSRDFDTIARYGGEEFVVILPGCGPTDALASAQRLHICVADQGDERAGDCRRGSRELPRPRRECRRSAEGGRRGHVRSQARAGTECGSRVPT